jgi:hypothetical protein
VACRSAFAGCPVKPRTRRLTIAATLARSVATLATAEGRPAAAVAYDLLGGGNIALQLRPLTALDLEGSEASEGLAVLAARLGLPDWVGNGLADWLVRRRPRRDTLLQFLAELCPAHSAGGAVRSARPASAGGGAAETSAAAWASRTAPAAPCLPGRQGLRRWVGEGRALGAGGRQGGGGVRGLRHTGLAAAQRHFSGRGAARIGAQRGRGGYLGANVMCTAAGYNWYHWYNLITNH